MISRYSRKEMVEIWSDNSRYARWLEVELAVCGAWSRKGKIPRAALADIRKKAAFDEKRISKLEKDLKHDVLAFLTCVSEKVGKNARYIHMGITSSDVLDTAFALQLKAASTIILKDMGDVMKVLKKLALHHKKTPMIGRSHGVHAEPKTLGLVFALWYDEMGRNLERMKRAAAGVSVGMMSGPVGTYSSVPPEVEKIACRELGLKPAAISTQIIHRDIHAEYFLCLSLIAAAIERIATEIRHFQRTEVLEMEEPFASGQKGSSAMPHKKNPILSENLCGLARVVRSHSAAALENIALWHERDISHSSVERVIAPDGTILIDFMLARLKTLLEGLVVHKDRLAQNMDLTKGLVFSHKVLLKIIDTGVSREKAYKIVQRNAMKCWEKKTDFRAILKEDAELKRVLSSREVDACFDISEDFQHIDAIFKRVFG
ncbi:MAG: adenylosuccinate lyase [Candidatus Mycalebacterium zealandia]|nr:MAG: adenylosuccinate lyase [Candidatus Mycalebacterium zealandia]